MIAEREKEYNEKFEKMLQGVEEAKKELYIQRFEKLKKEAREEHEGEKLEKIRRKFENHGYLLKGETWLTQCIHYGWMKNVALELFIIEDMDNRDKMNPFLYAAGDGSDDTKMLELFFGEAYKGPRSVPFDINVVDLAGGSALHHAARKGHEKKVRFLIEEAGMGKDKILEKDISGMDVLTVVAWYIEGENSIKITEFLLEKGADLNTVNSKSGSNVLHYTTRKDNLPLTRFFLEKEVDVNARNKRGETPFDLAKTEEMKALLDGYKTKQDTLISHVEKLQSSSGKSQGQGL